MCVSGRSISLEKKYSPQTNKNLFHKAVGAQTEQASGFAGCMPGQAGNLSCLLLSIKFPAHQPFIKNQIIMEETSVNGVGAKVVEIEAVNLLTWFGI